MNFAPIELFTLVHTLPLSFLELVGGDAWVENVRPYPLKVHNIYQFKYYK